MAYDAGEAYLQVVPVFRGVIESITAETRKWGDVGGKTFADSFNRAVRGAVDVPLGPSAAAAARQGAESGGAFGDAFKARVTAALRNLPKPQVGVNATELDAELADIRARLQALSDVRVGVDLDAGAALAEMNALQARLDELGARSPDVRVKVDAAAAAAELAAIQAQVDHLDGDNAAVDTSSGVSGLGALATAGIALGPAIIPVAAAVTAAIAGIGAGALAAVGGIGVLAIGLSGISKAVQELTASHDATAAAAVKSAAQQVSAAAAVANAEQGVVDARRGLADAERSGAQSVQAALERQQQAEQTLTAAQRTARQAQLDLSAARQQAKQDLEDLTLQVQDGALAQRQANLDVQAAREQLNKTLADPTATDLQRKQAQLAYDQAVQQVTDLTVRQKRLTDQAAAAAKAGVSGAPGVVAAQQKVSDAHQGVANAQQGVSDATAAVAEAHRAAAEAITRADERIVAADRALTVAHAQAANAAVASTAKTMKAFDELGPAGKRLATFIATSVVPAFKQLRDAIQANLLPGLERGLRALAPLMPGLTAAAASLAGTLGDLFAQGAKALQAPFWQQFFGFMASTMGPNLTIVVGVVENLARGFAGLFEAFNPVAQQVGQGVLTLTRRFADFGATAGSNSGFQHFIDYVQKVGPQVAHVLGDVVTAVAHITVALAPLGTIALAVIGGLATLINHIPTWVLTTVAELVAAIVVAVKAWEIAQAALNLVLDANPISLIVIALAALALGLYNAYEHSKTFRDIVQGAFKVVGEAAHAMWFDVIKPVLKFLVDTWLTVTGTILTAAADAFGWVPGIGGKLKAAARKFNDFRNEVNGYLDGVHRNIDVNIGFHYKEYGVDKLLTDPLQAKLPKDAPPSTSDLPLAFQILQGQRKATGGWITGGTPGIDSVPILAMPGEFVVRSDMSNLTDLLAGLSGGRTRPVVGTANLDQLTGNGQQGASSLIGEYHVHNPAAEPQSTSLPKAIRRAEFEAGFVL